MLIAGAGQASADMGERSPRPMPPADRIAIVGPAPPGDGGGTGAAGSSAGAGTVSVPFDDWRAAFRKRAAAAGISTATLDSALAGLRPDPDIVRRDRAQAESTKTIWDYLDTAVSADRIRRGIDARRDHAALLEGIEATHSVEANVLTAIWGLESAYGGYRGDVPVFRALATLAHDGRRGAFFEDQLIAALRIVQATGADPAIMTGSWAGAMGHTQFLPTTYLEHAVDFDGDGRRDIWSDDPADALASAAAYLAASGWVAGQPWGLEVRLPPGFDYASADRAVLRTVNDWTARGVTAVAGGALPDHGPAAILLPAGAAGAAFMIFANFAVLETYNAADAYVIAIGHLSDRIAGGPAIVGGWPRGDRALRVDERRELQRRLTDLGHDTQGVDGLIGPLTVAAVRSWQQSAALVPDGYAAPALLDRLRAQSHVPAPAGVPTLRRSPPARATTPPAE